MINATQRELLKRARLEAAADEHVAGWMREIERLEGQLTTDDANLDAETFERLVRLCHELRNHLHAKRLKGELHP